MYTSETMSELGEVQKHLLLYHKQIRAVQAVRLHHSTDHNIRESSQ